MNQLTPRNTTVSDDPMERPEVTPARAGCDGWNMQRLPRRVTHGVVIALAALPLVAGCSSSSGDKRADTLCEQLSENHTTAPDQIARRIYGDGQFATAAQGIRSACVEDHGAVAVYLDETANYSGGTVPQVPPGYGTSTF